MENIQNVSDSVVQPEKSWLSWKGRIKFFLFKIPFSKKFNLRIYDVNLANS